MADVRFTRNGQVTTLPAAGRIESREALGLWKVGNKAWKVYRTRAQLANLMEDYRRAEVDVGLPMGNPVFYEGKVQQGNERETNGFVLVTDWMTGTNFQKTKASFIAALERQNISHSKSNTTYIRIRRACVGANGVGLRDCQGFVQANVANPLQFVDVHTGWNKVTKKYNTSGQAKELLEVIDKWGSQS